MKGKTQLEVQDALDWAVSVRNLSTLKGHYRSRDLNGCEGLHGVTTFNVIAQRLGLVTKVETGKGGKRPFRWVGGEPTMGMAEDMLKGYRAYSAAAEMQRASKKMQKQQAQVAPSQPFHTPEHVPERPSVPALGPIIHQATQLPLYTKGARLARIEVMLEAICREFDIDVPM